MQLEGASILIAGTGASYDGGKNTNMARAFYQAGFHVVSISSPTHMNFIVAANSSGVPGHAYQDAEDLYRVMERIWDTLKDRIRRWWHDQRELWRMIWM